ncbi:MAG: hypothetical protein L6R40_004668 [Gallowayella cf. fulva]|nr:MAG: hypothetical protein L6R40_004668 [Xanthomendoza cf. fulva]
MSVIIRERERERDRDRDWDTRTSHGRDSSDRAGFTTVKRYRIPNRDEDDDRLSVYNRDRDRRSDRGAGGGSGGGHSFEETRIVRRERTPDPEPERREIRIERFERDRPPSPPRIDRDIRIERYEREREPDRRPYERDYRYEREVERPRRDPYDVERYSKSVEYFPRPDPPQPIIIRQEPQQIIIQEAPRAPIVIPAPQKEESEFQLIQRSEVNEDRQIARREPERRDDREEDYYYERRVREVSRDDRSRRGGDDEFYEEQRYRRREVSPGDSVSQVGRRRDRDYSSDDSMVYIRKETRDTYGRDESPHRKRHLAEGAIAGLGAAELIRHHKEREGDEKSSRKSRVGRDLGAAALGVAGAEAISRARSRHRNVVTVPEAVPVQSPESDNSQAWGWQQQLPPLHRSRTRRHAGDEQTDDARDPAHRNKKIAQAGLAGAAVAGLVERARSKSRGGRGKSRSKSRVRTGLPIAAAGLGSAAIAGLYEKNQAGKKEKESRKEARAERRRSRSISRSQSRSRSMAFDGPRSATGASDPGLIEYGDQPVYSAGGVPDFYNRPASQAGYREDAMVPAAAAATGAAYGAERSRERRRGSSSSSGSDGGRRRRHRRKKSNSRSRSRTRDLAAAGLGAAGAAAALSQHEKRKQQRKQEKRERRRYEAEHGPGSYDERDRDQYPPQQPYSPISPEAPGAQGAGYPQQQQDAYYPSTNQFPPPPAGGYAPSPGYDAAQYGQQPGQPGQPGQQIHPDYGYAPQQNPYVPPGAQGTYSPPPANPYAPPGGNARRADENVSAEPFFNSRGIPIDEQRAAEEGLSPRDPIARHRSFSQPASKSVQFNLDTPDTSSPSSPEHIRKRRQRTGTHDRNSHRDDNIDNEIFSLSDNPSTNHPSNHSASSSSSRPHRHRHHRHRRQESVPSATSNPNSSANTLVNSARSPSPAHSDATIDLPQRFDEKGRKIPEEGEDPLADTIEGLLGGGSGGIAKFMKGFLGGGEDDPLGDGGKNRRRKPRD